MLDPFVIYNQALGYSSIRTDIKDAYMRKHLDLLEQKHKVIVLYIHLLFHILFECVLLFYG